MILRKFIAVKAHLDSKGIAFGNLKYVEPLLKELLKNEKITVKKGGELLGHESNNARSILRLMEHTKVLEKVKDAGTKKIHYTLTEKAKKRYQKRKTDNVIRPIEPLLVDWLPLKLFLKYIEEAPGCKVKDVKEHLGEQVKEYTAEIAKEKPELGLKKGYLKPFNEMIISNVLVKMGQYLGLLEEGSRSGPYHLTKKGLNKVNSINLDL